MDNEEIELRKIVQSGKSKKVDQDTYNKFFYPGDCKYCLFYDWNLDRCNHERGYYDNNGESQCINWRYVYKL